MKIDFDKTNTKIEKTKPKYVDSPINIIGLQEKLTLGFEASGVAF